MSVENYIESKLRKLSESNELNTEFIGLYKNVQNESLKSLFSTLHRKIVSLFDTMNERLPTNEDENHYWADPSRNLILSIDTALGLYSNLKKSEYEFDIDPYYYELFKKCKTFLSKSGGSTIPKNMEEVTLYYTIPIFISKEELSVKKGKEEIFELKMIGEGSYARVFRYKDNYYNKKFVLKRAKEDLNEKEVERFKIEFNSMSKLSSPYIVEVHNFFEESLEYIMEDMDYTLDEFIKKNNTSLCGRERIGLGNQFLKALIYLHNKGMLHRDISPKNILLKKYEDLHVLKISDFGLVKIPDSEITSFSTELKGYFNDPVLATEGFNNYSIYHEMYAVTKVLAFIMTGKTNLTKVHDPKIEKLIQIGLSPDQQKRPSNIKEMHRIFNNLYIE